MVILRWIPSDVAEDDDTEDDEGADVAYAEGAVDVPDVEYAEELAYAERAEELAYAEDEVVLPIDGCNRSKLKASILFLA